MTRVVKIDLTEKYQTALITGQIDNGGPDYVGPIFEVRFLVPENLYLYSPEFEQLAWKALKDAKRQFMESTPHTVDHSILDIAQVSSDYLRWVILTRTTLSV